MKIIITANHVIVKILGLLILRQMNVFARTAIEMKIIIQFANLVMKNGVFIFI